VRFKNLISSLVLAAFAAGAPAAEQAQSTPRGPIRILVGFAPGGGTDVTARLLANRIKDAIGQPVIVENKAGAGGRIAAMALKNAAPDGSTLLLTPMFVTVLAPLEIKRPGYEPTRDFAPVSQVAEFQIAFAVAANHPASTVSEFVAWAKSNGTDVSFGTPGAGSQPHFFGVMVGKATGLEMVHIPYKGSVPMVTDLMGGRIPVGITALSDLLTLHRANTLRIIATSGAKRSPLLPAVPTFKEQGFPEIEGTGWLGLYAPAGTPKPVIEQWSLLVTQAVRVPAISERLLRLGLEPSGSTTEEFAKVIAADTARWRPIVKASGFTLD
jgi:tripartite-type tricarboxylate transporter receptor subunit TctC